MATRPRSRIGQGYIVDDAAAAGDHAGAASSSNRAVVPHLVRPAGIMKAGKPFDPDLGAKDFAAMGFNPLHINAVLGGMNAVTNEPGGTAYGARITDPGMEMGGKSGTSQVRQITAAEREHGMQEAASSCPGRTATMRSFIAFAPVGNPRYACAVCVEHGIAAASIAGPDRARRAARMPAARSVAPGAARSDDRGRCRPAT